MDTILYFACVLALAFALYTQIKVRSTYKRYSRESTVCGLAAHQVARMILDMNGLHDVRVECISGSLNDHYDSRNRVIRLSSSVYNSSSAAAVGIAAHEVGHALQYATSYAPIKARQALVRTQGFASSFTWIVIMIAFFVISFNATLGYYVLLLGIGLFSLIALFELVTLPCEFNASRRALACLREMGTYSEPELSVSKKVLSAAAMTYVAALVSTVVQIIRLLNIIDRR